MISKIINYLHSASLLQRLFNTLNYRIRYELRNCSTVLDLGCGPNSPIKGIENIKYSLGVEAFEPYLLSSKKYNIHTEYLNEDINTVNFEDNSFDAVLLIDVVEHLPKEKAILLIEKTKKWAKTKVIVSTPNGFIKQGVLDGNEMQKHLCGFSVDDLAKLGFKCYGMAGLKCLRKDIEVTTMGADLTNNIRYSPKLLFFIIATLSQLAVLHFPRSAFSLFSVHKK